MADAASSTVQPIIIRRKRVKKSDGHHGGAWKVAYADFVTAMMAFFLLMWLLNATTEDQRKGIADYFNPSIPISRISGGGADGLNGSSIFTEETLARMGTGASARESVQSQPSQTVDEEASSREVAETLSNLQAQLTEQGQQLSEHVLIKMSPEGIILEITDSEDSPLFLLGSSEPSSELRQILAAAASSFARFENPLRLIGHTDDVPFRTSRTYDNWDLSIDRALVARRILVEAGVAPVRINEVVGRADTDPLVPETPSAPQNRRISILIETDMTGQTRTSEY